MHRPIIGVTCNTIPAEGNIMPAMVRTFINTDYVNAVAKAGGAPILLPLVTDYASVFAQLSAVDGIILSGGPDVAPEHYGEEPLKQLGIVDQLRDHYELLVVKTAEELKKPMFGICRGIQLINVFYGGTLYQDVSLIDGCNLKHFQTTAQRSDLWHTVDVAPSSMLASIITDRKLQVNSYHHQAVKKVAPGFIVTAHSTDGVIEAIERQCEHFVLAVQWHPELLAETTPSMLALFHTLVNHAGKR